MIAIGRYLVFIIYLAGLTLSVEGKIREEDKAQFFNDIYALHNEYRVKHRVEELIRTPEMDLEAAQILDDMFKGQINQDYDVYGNNILVKMYDRYTTLNTAEARRVFLKWYDKVNKYNFFSEPSDYEPYKEFTQIVWKETQWFGIAMRWTNDKYILFIIYYPRGNILGQFKDNVLQRPIIADCNNTFSDRFLFENVEEHFEDYIVYLHNEARIKHGVPILQRDPKLNGFADHILSILARRMYHYYGMYGKNSLRRNYDVYTLLDEAEASAIFFTWYNKGEDYNYAVEPSNNEAAQFTQIIWKSTKKIGLSIRKEEKVYKIIAFYDPPGNIEGEFKSNVLMPKSIEQGESSSSIDNST